jgi:hypothetical protein
MMAKVELTTDKDREGALDLSISYVASLLTKLTDAKMHMHASPNKDKGLFIRVALEDAMRKVEDIKELLDLLSPSFKPSRREKKSGLTLSADGLVEFDDNYFDYLNPNSAEYSDYSRSKAVTVKDLCYRLATWVFDDGNTKQALSDVKKAFGEDVYKRVKRNIQTRNHDT